MCPRNPKSRGIFSKILCECNHGPENTEEFDPRFSMNVPISLRMRSCDSRGATNTTLLQKCRGDSDGRQIQWLISRGWICIADESIKGNHTLVVEFYPNALETEFGIESWATSGFLTKLYADRVVLIDVVMDGIEIDVDEEKKPVKEIHPLKRGRLGDMSKKRKVDIEDPEFDQFTETVSDASTSTVPLYYGPATKRHLSSQIHEVRDMMESISSVSYGAPKSMGVPPPTIAYVVAAQRDTFERLEHLSCRQGNIE
ncbi:hypothetical protein KY284_026749 [Solanum tuberosum]|nr:hypothetical protein KY284_026749 [Solanum tuberosum]